MTRSVTAETLAQAGAGSARPLYFVEIEWPTFSSRLCSYGTLSWGGGTWSGAGIEVGDFDETSAPSRITIADPDNVFRTLILADGIRDRPIRIWKAYADALDSADPIEIFAGVGDGGTVRHGRVVIDLGRTVSRWDQTPRERISPAFGVNFTAPPGTKVHWGGTTLVLNSRN